MGILEYILLILVIGGGAFVQRVTGFGMGIFAMLFLPYFLPSSGASAAVIGMLSCVINVYHGVAQRKHILWKTMLPAACVALAVIPLAVHLSADLPQAVLERLLGVVLMVLSVYFLFFSKRIHLKPTVPNGMLAGALGGMLNGLFSTGGPPVVLYLIHATTDKMAYFATIQAYFGITNLFSTANRLLNGIITPQIAGMAAVALIGLALGDRLGNKVFDKLDADRLRKVIYVGMLFSGMLMIL